MRIRTEPASVRRRLLSGVIDTTVVVAAGGLIAAALFRADSFTAERAKRAARLITSPWGARALNLVIRLGTLPVRNRRSPGQMVTGIRRVDARTHGPISPRSWAIIQLVELGYGRAAARLLAPWRRRFERRRAEAEAEAALETRAGPAGEHPEREHVTGHADAERGIGCLASLATGLPISLVIPLSALLSPRRQTIADRLAGVLVIHER